MKFEENDIIKFYTLFERFNITSTNIGIVGSTERFKRYINSVLKTYEDIPNKKVIINEDKTICRIIVNDIERNYIHIRDTQDLIGRYFKKFI